MPKFPQIKENLALPGRVLPESLVAEVTRLNEALDGHGRVLVRRSGTEPVVRVLAEAQTEAEAQKLCGTIASLVRRELG